MSASAADHEPPSPTLFMDRAGSAHRSLDGAIREHRRSSSPQHQHGPPADHTLAFPAALEYTPSGRSGLHFPSEITSILTAMRTKTWSHELAKGRE
jgi:hypothetical protein